MRITRDPDGRFISPGTALRVWLPELLETHKGGDPLRTMLEVAAEWCEKKAAHRYDMAAWVLGTLSTLPNPTELAKRDAEFASRWLHNRSELLSTIQRLRGAK